MKHHVVVVLMLLCVGSMVVALRLSDLREADELMDEVDESVGAQHMIRITNIPASYDLRNTNNTNYCTPARSQYATSDCGASWAVAVAGALSDRLLLQRHGAWPVVELSPQMLLNCASEFGTCESGKVVLVHEWIHENGLTDETCAPYLGRDDIGCDSKAVCKTCAASPNGVPSEEYCAPVQKPMRVFVDLHGSLLGEHAMKSEIYRRGPIVCSMQLTNDVLAWGETPVRWEESTVYIPPRQARGKRVAVVVVGWGVDNQTREKYWIVRTSLGSFWHSFGYFKLQRGTGALGTEQKHCYWATPSV